MLQSLRDKAQGWMAWIIITLIAITFVLFGASNFLDMGRETQIAAKVNGKKITVRELDIAYDNQLQQPGNEALQSLDQYEVKKDILQTMIEQTVITQQALRSGMRISSHYITSTIHSLPFLQVDKQFSPEAYRRLLQNYNYTEKTFRTLVADDLIRGQLQQGIAQTAFVTAADLDQAIALVQQQRSFRVTRFPREAYERQVTVTPEDIEQYYKAHLADYKTDEKVKLAYVMVALPDLVKQFNPDEKTIETYYKSHISEFTQPEKMHIAHIMIGVPSNADKEAEDKALAKVASIQDQLKHGRSFADLAKETSDDPASATNGGVLAWYSQGEMMPEIEKASAQLKPGQISEPVKTRFGYHLIELLERHPSKVESLDAVKSQIMTQLKNQMAEEKFMQAVDDLGTLSYDAPDSLQPVADKLGLTIHTTGLFGRNEAPEDPLLKNPAVTAAAFSPSVAEDKNNSDVIKIDEGHYIVLRAVDYVPQLQMPLTDVTAAVQKRLIEERSSDLAKQAALEAQATMLEAKATMVNDVMHKYSWNNHENVTRLDNSVNSDILNGAFALPDTPQTNDRLMKVVSYDKGDYALVWLTGVKNGEPSALTAEEKEGFAELLVRHLGQLDYMLYVKGITNEAKITNKWDKSGKAE